jgi:CheY-like chemotaxis protein
MVSNGKYKVYLIDDDEDEFLLFQQAIAELNINVEMKYINNCGEMLELLDKGDIPDLLFLDLNMPMISGRDAPKMIRALPRLSFQSFLNALRISFSPCGWTRSGRV